MHHQIEELREWAQWATTNASEGVSSKEKAIKAKDKFLHHWDDQSDRLVWSSIVWSAKQTCMISRLDHEGKDIIDLIELVLETNPGSFHAAIIYSLAGIKVSSELLRK